jgi:hypothetical protein
MVKAKKSAAKTARKRKIKIKVGVQAPRKTARKSKPVTRKSAVKPKPAKGIVGKLENAVHLVVDTIKETTDLRRKMHADQPEE